MSLIDDVHRALGSSVPREHVAAVLAEVKQRAVVVEHAKLPTVRFEENEGGEPVVYIYRTGGPPKEVPFSDQHLSKKRARTAVRDALAILAAITTDVPFLRGQWTRTKLAYERRCLAIQHVEDGGAPALTDGLL